MEGGGVYDSKYFIHDSKERKQKAKPRRVDLIHYSQSQGQFLWGKHGIVNDSLVCCDLCKFCMKQKAIQHLQHELVSVWAKRTDSFVKEKKAWQL